MAESKKKPDLAPRVRFNKTSRKTKSKSIRSVKTKGGTLKQHEKAHKLSDKLIPEQKKLSVGLLESEKPIDNNTESQKNQEEILSQIPLGGVHIIITTIRNATRHSIHDDVKKQISKLSYKSIKELQKHPPAEITTPISISHGRTCRVINYGNQTVTITVFSNNRRTFTIVPKLKTKTSIQPPKITPTSASKPVEEHINNNIHTTSKVVFSTKEISELYDRSQEFAEIIDSGMYRLLNGHIVLFHPKCSPPFILKKIDRNPRQHCLSIVEKNNESIEIIHAKKYNELASTCYFGNTQLKLIEPERITSVLKKGDDLKNSNSCSNPQRESSKRKKNPKKEIGSTGEGGAGGSDGSDQSGLTYDSGGNDGFSGSNLTPSDVLKDIIQLHLKHLKLSLRAFCDITYIREESIRRIYSRPGSSSKLSTVVAVCLGLHMDPEVSFFFINLAGQNLGSEPQMTKIYRLLLEFYYNESMETINQYLKDNNYLPLTTPPK